MCSKFIPLQIYLKGKDKPVEIEATKDMILYLTDFMNDNMNKQTFTMEYINRNKKRFLVIQKGQIQALHFDDFNMN